MKIGGGVIKIHISSADDKLMLTIADDGLGMTQEDLDKLNRDVDAGKQMKMRRAVITEWLYRISNED